jgi:EXS family
VEVHKQLTNLRSFADVNYLCVVKVMRKYDALEGGGGGDASAADDERSSGGASSSSSSGAVLSIAAGLSFGDFTAIDASIDAAEALYAGLFTGGQRGLARVGLLVESRPAFNWGMFDAGVRVGVMLILATWLGWNVLVDIVQPTPGENASAAAVHAAAPVFRGVGCLILVVWLWGAQLWVWTKAHVNYMLLFDSDPRTSLDYRVVLREASSMTIWFLSALLLVGPLRVFLTAVCLFAPLFHGKVVSDIVSPLTPRSTTRSRGTR